MPKVSQSRNYSSTRAAYPTNNDPDYLDTIIGRRADALRVWRPEELVALADSRRQEPVGAPGAGHFYSDTNYVLLGLIIEAVTGQPFKQRIRTTLLEPLGMHSTWFYSEQLNGLKPPLAPVRGYLLATDELRTVIEISPIFQAVSGGQRPEGAFLDTTLAAERIDAAAGLVTTLPDLRKFASAVFRGKLLSPSSQAFLFRVGEGMSNEATGTSRTSTLQALRKPHGVLLYKQGDGPGGVNTLMAYAPEPGLIFIGFTNVFGYFDEVDVMMDTVLADFARRSASGNDGPAVP